MNEITTAENTQKVMRTPHTIATEINSIKEQTRKMVLFNSIEIGRRLVEAKEVVAHGEWENWLKDSVDFSLRTAQNLMKVFQEYGSDQTVLFGDNAKTQAFALLSYSQAVELLKLPFEERENFIKENDVENMSTRELQQAIKDRDEALKQKEKVESDLKATKVAFEMSVEKRKEAEKKVEALNEQIQEGIDLRESYLKQIDEYKEKLSEAQAAGNDEEAERLQTSLEETEKELETSKTRIEELERQLKEKPIEVPATVEVIPEETQKELEDLRAKIGQSKAEEATIKFTLCFKSLVNGFDALLGTLGEIEDTETQQKYKGAVTGLLGKMSERLQ